MRWASALSCDPSLPAALAEAAALLRDQLAGAMPDLVVAFVSAHHAADFERVPELLATRWPSALQLGCSAGGVIGGGREAEQRPGISITAAALPGVALKPVRLLSDALPGRSAALSAWHEQLGLDVAAEAHFIVLADPFSFEVEALLQGLDRAYPGSRTIGGLASGARQAGQNALFLAGHTHRAGAVAVAVSGDVALDTIVAQGCRPIGEPMFVTRCDRNLIWELDGERPLKVLQTLHESLDQRDKELMRHSLFFGIAMNEDRQEYRQGDFLIRNLAGADADSGALAVGAVVRETAVVQFHLRDARTSAEDLDELLARHAREQAAAPAGALLFSCLGRGQFLYGRPDHDTDAVRRHLGEVPLGGFFCNGEIGPVHGTSFLHGYTSSFGLFRPRR